jgi:hypothetical protein
LKILHGRVKTKIPKIEAVIEQDLVYPAIRGSDIQRWRAFPKISILITHPASKHNPVSRRRNEKKMAKKL